MGREAAKLEPWEEVLEELKRFRRDAARGERELWRAIEDLHDLVLERNPTKEGKGQTDDGRRKNGSRLEPRDYRRLRRELWRFAAENVPEGSRVAVVSRGDEELVDIPGVEAEHFPRDPEGAYAGFYPPDGTAAIAHLEWVRAFGAEYILFPDTAAWWIEAFPTFAAHLRERYPVVASRDRVGFICSLHPLARETHNWTRQVSRLLEAWTEEGKEPASLLDWDTGCDLAAQFPGSSVFSPPEKLDSLPYLDSTVDVVALVGDDPARLTEARRVARRSVVRLPANGTGLLDEVDADGANAAAVSAEGLVEHLTEVPDALPSISVIIPTYEGLKHLEPCLLAVESSLPEDFRGEVLVVDDGSGVETSTALAAMENERPWLRVVRNSENLGFIGSCNRGAAEARGELLVFLNDDTVPLPGWLVALAGTFRTKPEAGVVGGRLIYPDGRLQEAGCSVFRDGTGANLGRGDYDVDAPIYGHLRPVHYCSGALLATPRDLFQALGGFDVRFKPAYYEDTDYCFSVRAAGHGVYYQPEARVVHLEGATSGTDAGGGIKRYQIRNRRTFREKWAAELDHHPEAPATYSSLTWHRLALAGGTQ